MPVSRTMLAARTPRPTRGSGWLPAAAPAGGHPLLDALMVHAAAWGEAIFIGVIVGWFLASWRRGRVTDRQGAVTAAVGAGVALLVNVAISHVWTRPRPFVTHPLVHMLLRHGADASFPSDHSFAAFAIAGGRVEPRP